MKILVIGGTGFLGLHLVSRLLDSGHEVRVYSRGQRVHLLPPGAKRVSADLSALSTYKKILRPMAFDAVVHLIASTAEDASAVTDAFANDAGRIVAVSSVDVYQAFGALINKEDVPPSAAALDEAAPLRTSRDIYGEGKERIAVEQVFASESDRIPTTILRIPFLYGPDDPRQRLYPWVKRFDDQRPAVLLSPSYGNFRMTHAYVENVAHALFLAVTTPQPDEQPLRLYNVGEERTPTTAERLHDLARAAGYKGKIIVIPRDLCLPHMEQPVDLRHDLVLNDNAIRRELGYKEIVTPEAGLERTIAWQRTVCPLDIDHDAFNYPAEDLLLRRLGILT
jgi:nucleoside-diphosphate-sugar epimerase